MNICNAHNSDLHNRVHEKQSHRNQDVSDLMSKKFSRSEIQQRNSMFSGIDWSDVKISEPDGYKWQPDQSVN